MTATITHNRAEHRFEVNADGSESVLEYRPQGNTIVIHHTKVPEQAAGRGIGASLVTAALEFARQEGLKVVPQCTYAASFIEKHPEYADLVDGV